MNVRMEVLKMCAEWIRARRANPNNNFVFGNEDALKAMARRGVRGPRGRLP